MQSYYAHIAYKREYSPAQWLFWLSVIYHKLNSFCYRAWRLFFFVSVSIPFSGWMHILAEKMKIPVNNITHSEAYVTALYYTFTSLTSVGFGNVSANTKTEKVFTIIMMLIGGK